MSRMERVPPLAQFEESPMRRVIMQRLREVEVQEVIPYSVLSGLVGGDVQREQRHLLASATKALLRERIVFGAVTNVGLKRLNDMGIVDRAETGLTRIQRAARRSGRILTLADYEQLSPVDQKRYRITQIRLGATVQFGGKKALGQITRAVEASVTAKQLKAAIAQSLDQF